VRARTLIAAAAVVGLAACGGTAATAGSGSTAATASAARPPCNARHRPVLLEGAPARLDASGDWDTSCVDAAGKVHATVTVSWTCTDGSKLVWMGSEAWMRYGVVHVGAMDVNGDGQGTSTDITAACR
jgi:hypothetical protein